MRAFLAVEPGESDRRQIARVIQQLSASVESDARRARVTWVRPEAIHLTVRFFEDIDERLATPLRDAVLETTSGVVSDENGNPSLHSSGGFRIPLARIGAFPRIQAPRALWIGPPSDWQTAAEGVRLSRLIRKINDACDGVRGAGDEQPWRPHLTIARVRTGERDVGRVLAANGFFDQPLDVDALRVTGISLIKSELRPAGPVYTRLWTAAF